MLRKAGHRAAVVTVPEELARIVRRDKWDVVVIDVADGEAIKSLLSVRETSPVLLPVVDSASDNNLALVKKEYGCVLESPAKTQSFMDAIDAALALKETTRQKSDAKLTR
jgi:DNA-binding NtrC family response regulator